MAASLSMGKVVLFSSYRDEVLVSLQCAEDRDERWRLIQCDQQIAYGLVCCYSWVALPKRDLSNRFFIHVCDSTISV